MKKPCPICKQPTDLSKTNGFRPFCSERCKLLDLSNWLNEDYAFPGDPVPPNSDSESRTP